jgi:hypothetical protein
MLWATLHYYYFEPGVELFVLCPLAAAAWQSTSEERGPRQAASTGLSARCLLFFFISSARTWEIQDRLGLER